MAGLAWGLARAPAEVGAAAGGEVDERGVVASLTGEGGPQVASAVAAAVATGDGASEAGAPGEASAAAESGLVAGDEGATTGMATTEGGTTAAAAAETTAVAGATAGRRAAPRKGAEEGRRRTTEAAHESRRCAQVREVVRVSREAFRWQTVLELVRERSCWEHRDDARKLEVQARMELGDLDGCVRAATGMTDREVVRWRAICQKRGGAG